MKTTCSKSFLRLLFILSLDLKFNASWASLSFSTKTCDKDREMAQHMESHAL